MAPLSLPLRTDVPEYTYSIDLDGKAFQLEFKYNEREEMWHLSLSTPAGAPLLLGLPLVVGYPVLFAYRSKVDIPAGEFEFIDLEGKNGRPTRDSLAQRFELLYHPAADVAAIRSGG